MGREPNASKPHRHTPRSWPKLPAALAGSEICVTELADLENEKLTTVSARLRTLHEARLVKRRREAKHIYYALFDTHVLQLVQSAIEHAAEKH